MHCPLNQRQHNGAHTEYAHKGCRHGNGIGVQHLGARLLTRTTRSLALTDSGAVYFEQVKHLVRDLELAHAAVTEHKGEPQGRLRIASSAAFGRHVLAPLMPAFQKRYPGLALELITTDRSVDHITEQVDVSIRIREQLEDSLVARRIARIPSLFVASPDYLARAGRPGSPEELQQHDCLVFRVPADGRLLRWFFYRDGVRFAAPVKVTMVSDDIDVLARAAMAGGGIARLAAFVAQPLVASGALVDLFPAVEPLLPRGQAERAEIEPLDFYCCVRDRYELTPKVRAFSDFLLQQLPPQWRL